MYAFQALNTRFLCFMEVEAIKSMYGQQFHHVLVYINVLFPRKEILLLSKHSAVLVSALKP